MDELLQKRLSNRLGDQASKLANPEISMAPFGSIDTSAVNQAMRDLAGQTKGAISNREMELVEKNLPFYGSQKMVDPRDLAKPQPFMSSGEPFTEDMLQKLGAGQTKGAISNAEMQLLEQAQMEAGETFTPEEKELVLAQIRKLEKQSQAPNFPLTQQLASMGTGDDTVIAHLEPGEVVLAKEFMEDPEFESVVESKFREFGIDPAQAIVDDPRGIISLDTGAQQFGFFKKVGKFLKKVVTPVAKVAQFIPGPWQAPAALISKAATVRDVARGDTNPLALLSVAGPTAVGGSLSENIAGIKAAGDGSFLKGLGSLGGKTLSGIGKAVTNPMEAIRGIPSLMKSATMSGQPRAGANTPADAMLDYQNALKQNPALANMAPLSPVDPSLLSAKDAITANIANLSDLANVADLEGNTARAQQYDEQVSIFKNQLADINSQIASQQSTNQFPDFAYPAGAENYDQMISNMAKGMSGQSQTGTGQQRGSQPQSGARGTTGGIGGFGNLGDLGRIGVTGGLAGALAKLAYDETKKDKGVALTPLTQMDATGRYNIEAEIARRTGQPAPNPVEFGLLPAGTFPTLSGGQPMQANEGGVAQKQYPNKGLEALAKVAPQVVDRMGYYGGGMVTPMAYAEGGNVDMNEFQRMNGRIDGQGTETSDDIPAMLSDGEFVMTGQAVRGAGSFEMQEGAGGIISLVPSLDESRERGIDLMYKMMDAFAGKAQPSQEPA